MWPLVKEKASPAGTDVLVQVAQGQEGPHSFLFSFTLYCQECPTPAGLMSTFALSLQGSVAHGVVGAQDGS